MVEPSAESSNENVIQHGPEFYGDRAATLILIQHLKEEKQRIESELHRINDRLCGVVDSSDYQHIDLHETSRELQALLDRVNAMIGLEEGGELQSGADESRPRFDAAPSHSTPPAPDATG